MVAYYRISVLYLHDYFCHAHCYYHLYCHCLYSRLWRYWHIDSDYPRISTGYCPYLRHFAHYSMQRRYGHILRTDSDRSYLIYMVTVRYRMDRHKHYTHNNPHCWHSASVCIRDS
jgi:hypothetical protein